MTTTLQGKRALVTGGSRGIGAAIAKGLAAAGADVAITFEKASDAASAVVKDIETHGRRGVAIKADSGDAPAVESSIERAASSLGGLDILVNNAGIIRLSDLKDLSLDDINALINVNIRGPIVASKAALKYLGAGGRIISIGSYFADRVPFSLVGVYSATKSALTAFTKGLAREVGPKGITVNVVQPGPIDTDMNPEAGPYSTGQLQLTSLQKYGKPADIAALVTFLSSPSAQYITGTAITADGGANA
jgi:3-oxoacyl-[acyl-carrier protein] reductase